MTEALKVCPKDGEPVVFTMEFPGAEHYCVVCGWKGDIFAPLQQPATRELIARAAEIHDRYEAEYSERTGRPVRAPSQDVDRPVCGGCDKEAEGRLDHSGKPAHWYSRTRDGVTSYACSRGCIPTDEGVLPW